MMRPKQGVGIAGYGVYIPRYRIAAREIARVWGAQGGLPVESKSVPGPDEDTITMAIEAARTALARARVGGDALSAVWVGSESHPYSVKPSGTIVASDCAAGPTSSAAAPAAAVYSSASPGRPCAVSAPIASTYSAMPLPTIPIPAVSASEPALQANSQTAALTHGVAPSASATIDPDG